MLVRLSTLILRVLATVGAGGACDRAAPAEVTTRPSSTASTTPAPRVSASSAPIAEAPPSFTPPAAKPEKVPTYRIDSSWKKTMTLEGTFKPHEPNPRLAKDVAPSPGVEPCFDWVRLDFSIRVFDTDGKEAEPGGTTDVCVMHWVGRDEHEKKPKPPMLQPGSHVTLRGVLSRRILGRHPNMIQVWEAILLSATPPDTPAPPANFPDGTSFAYVRSVDATTRAITLDLAYLYYGEAAKRAAAARGVTLPPDRTWFVVNDSPQVRTVHVAPDESAFQLFYDNGGAWRRVGLADLAPATPLFIHFENGELAAQRHGHPLSVVNFQ